MAEVQMNWCEQLVSGGGMRLALGIRKPWWGPVLLIIRELKERERVAKSKVAVISAHQDLTSLKAPSSFFLLVPSG